MRADQESYYVMDDRSNDEFPYFPFPDDTLPFLQGGRRGVGLQVEVRNFQWSNPLAEDIVISIYQVKNVSEKPLTKNIVGMYVDAALPMALNSFFGLLRKSLRMVGIRCTSLVTGTLAAVGMFLHPRTTIGDGNRCRAI